LLKPIGNQYGMVEPQSSGQSSFTDRVVRRYLSLLGADHSVPTANHVRQAITEALSESGPVGFLNNGYFVLSPKLSLEEWKWMQSGQHKLFTAPQPTAEVLAKPVDERASRERFADWAVEQISGNGIPYFCMKNKDGEYYDGGTTHALKGWQAREAEVLALQEQLKQVRDFVSSDTSAITFQSLRQYRNALLTMLK
jgi:hypothetical protein